MRLRIVRYGLSKAAVSYILALNPGLLSGGCSTTSVHALDQVPLHPYVGSKTAVKKVFSSSVDYDYYGQPFAMIVDVPFCMAVNRLILPYDVIVWVNRKSRNGEW